MIHSDTLPEAWEVQLSIYRQMPPIRRLEVALNLTDVSRSLVEKGIRHEHPEYSEEQVKAETIRLWLHDNDLYRRVYGSSSLNQL